MTLKSPEITGSMTALVTPFKNGAIDFDCLASLVDRQIKGGTDWLVPCGTTGESPTLSHEEHDRVIEQVIESSAGRCPVMAGAGANCTTEAVRLSEHAAKAGAGAILSVVPYYNRPSQQGLFQHFARVAEAVDIPVVLYNVPVRTGRALDNETVARLRQSYPNIAAIKHATGQVAGVDELLRTCDISVLSGDDALTWPLMALGATGVISVIANLVPQWMKELVKAGHAGNRAQVLPIHRKVQELAEALAKFGPNPIPIKTAMAIAGLIEEEFRLPLCPLDSHDRALLEKALCHHELTTDN